jgi:hypothetical protein
MSLFLIIYLLLSYAGGIIITIMELTNQRYLTVGDLLMLILAPFAMLPIIMVQLLSHLIDIDEPIIKL